MMPIIPLDRIIPTAVFPSRNEISLRLAAGRRPFVAHREYGIQGNVDLSGRVGNHLMHRQQILAM